MRTTIAILAVATLTASAAANAGLVTYTLNDVTFDDGGTASGFFARDTADPSSLVSTFDVQVTAGSRIDAFDYSAATVDGGVASVSLNVVDQTFPLSALFLAGSTTAGRHIELGVLDNPLHPGINQIAMDCLSMLCSADLTESGLIRFVTGGTVTVTVSIPEPSSFGFVALGVVLLGILGGIKRTLIAWPSWRKRQGVRATFKSTP